MRHIAILAFILFITHVSAIDGARLWRKHPWWKPPPQPKREQVYPDGFQGCFNALPAAIGSRSKHVFNCAGWCLNQCRGNGYAVAALKGSDCICTVLFPRRTAYIEDAECNLPCPGYPRDSCGSARGAYSVYGTGLEMNTQHDDDTSSIFTWDSDWTKIAQPDKLYEAASGWTENIQNFFNQCLGRRPPSEGSGGKQAGIGTSMEDLEYEQPQLGLPKALENSSVPHELI